MITTINHRHLRILMNVQNYFLIFFVWKCGNKSLTESKEMETSAERNVCANVLCWDDKLFPFSNYATLRTMNDKLWTNVSKYDGDDDDDWLLFSFTFSLSLVATFSCLCKSFSLVWQIIGCQKVFVLFSSLWHFNKLNPPMHDIFDTFWYTSAHFIMACKTFFFAVYLHNNSWNSNPILCVRNKTHNTNEMCVFIFVLFVSLVIHIYIVLSHIAQHSLSIYEWEYDIAVNK